MGMVLPGGMMDSDINRHCAHNFPAVAYTLGRANWPQLRDTYNKLATDDQVCGWILWRRGFSDDQLIVMSVFSCACVFP
ncbi:unnamed protein product [Nippostrongylus brasiliensis]|uniref:DUF2623 family protein n=1 Tax=Nippostrongylus brasiliensis TaxID=27835 RepID=A0A0N4XVD3_NIPBR|nr:unnamed protein product [Nippostrongylus brasiliensis]